MANANILETFIDLQEQLLDTLSVCFPECSQTKLKLSQLGSLKAVPGVKEKIIREWHGYMQPFYENIRAGDISGLRQADIPIINDLRLWEKWTDPEFNDESREILLEYIQQLNTYSMTWNSIPKALMSRLEDAAQTLSEKLNSGQGNINIMEMGEELLKSMTQEDMEDFQRNAGPLMAQLASGMGGMESLMSTVTSSAMTGAPVDLNDIMSRIGKM